MMTNLHRGICLLGPPCTSAIPGCCNCRRSLKITHDGFANLMNRTHVSSISHPNLMSNTTLTEPQEMCSNLPEMACSQITIPSPPEQRVHVGIPSRSILVTTACLIDTLFHMVLAIVEHFVSIAHGIWSCTGTIVAGLDPPLTSDDGPAHFLGIFRTPRRSCQYCCLQRTMMFRHVRALRNHDGTRMLQNMRHAVHAAYAPPPPHPL